MVELDKGMNMDLEQAEAAEADDNLNALNGRLKKVVPEDSQDLDLMGKQVVEGM